MKLNNRIIEKRIRKTKSRLNKIKNTNDYDEIAETFNKLAGFYNNILFQKDFKLHQKYFELVLSLVLVIRICINMNDIDQISNYLNLIENYKIVFNENNSALYLRKEFDQVKEELNNSKFSDENKEKIIGRIELLFI